MKYFFTNFLNILKSPSAMIIGMIVWWWLALTIYHFSNFLLMQGNFGRSYAYAVIIFDILNILLTTLFIAATTRKRTHFGKKNTKNSRGIIGSFFATLVSWCPSCSITLATYLWLSTFITALPRWWIELKIIGALILLYVCYDTIKNLTVCKMR